MPLKGMHLKQYPISMTKLDTPTDLKATYDPATKEINLSWKYKNANNLDVEFVITSNDGIRNQDFYNH